MSPVYYYGFWIVYALASLVAYRALWQVTGWPRLWWLSALVRIMAIVVLVTPAVQAEGSVFFAPAWITMIFDELQHLEDGWFRAGINLMSATVLGLGAYFVYLIFSFLQRRRKIKRT